MRGFDNVFFLPGLDGTAQLSQRFLAAAPAHLKPTLLVLPTEPLTYLQLSDWLTQRISKAKAPILIAESFSGPLAVLIAQRQLVRALVFCNSFVVAPRSSSLRWLVLRAAFSFPLPHLLVRHYLVGHNADERLVRQVATTVASVPASVLASRVRLALTVDETMSFAGCNAPALYLRGSDDRLVTDASWRRMAALRPLTVVEVPGPHMLLQTDPLSAWREISRFIVSLQDHD